MLQWRLKSFQSLTLEELYMILRMRQDVFIVEQNCPFIDADNKDQYCYHLWGSSAAGEFVAYARIVPPGVIYKEASIGRIITPLKSRRSGFGKEIMQKSIEETEKLYGTGDIRIMAQQYLKRFYESFGFVQEGESFLEDGIVHIMMLRKGK